MYHLYVRMHCMKTLIWRTCYLVTYPFKHSSQKLQIVRSKLGFPFLKVSDLLREGQAALNNTAGDSGSPKTEGATAKARGKSANSKSVKCQQRG